MAKMIKFDLPVNGVKVKNFGELQDNFHTDLLPYLKSGKLAKWFLSRELADKAAAVQAIDSTQSDLTQLTALCEVLELEVDDDILANILAMPEKLAQAQVAQSKDWRGRDLSGRLFIGKDLSNYNFARADLSNANLSNAILSNANLRRADLSNAILSNAILWHADLTDAKMK